MGTTGTVWTRGVYTQWYFPKGGAHGTSCARCKLLHATELPIFKMFKKKTLLYIYENLFCSSSFVFSVSMLYCLFGIIRMIIYFLVAINVSHCCGVLILHKDNIHSKTDHSITKNARKSRKSYFDTVISQFFVFYHTDYTIWTIMQIEGRWMEVKNVCMLVCLLSAVLYFLFSPSH